MPLEAVESPRLYRQIADQLRHLIDRREFPAGCRLPPERELAEKLGVSRPSVREALIALEVEGRVRIRMGSGVYVVDDARKRPSIPAFEGAAEGPFEVLQARELIEGAICAEAAGCVSADRLAELDGNLDRMEAGQLSGDELVALDRAFHVAIAEALGNAVVTSFVGALFDQRINPYFRRLASHFENEASWRDALHEHRAIREALAAGKSQAAREAMRVHLQRSAARFSRSFGEALNANGQDGVDAWPGNKNGRKAGNA